METQPIATVQEENPAKAETADIDSLIVEKTDDELDLKQFFYSYEDRSMDNEGERFLIQIGLNTFLKSL